MQAETGACLKVNKKPQEAARVPADEQVVEDAYLSLWRASPPKAPDDKCDAGYLQWKQSNYIDRDKLFGASSSLSLDNFVTPQHIDPVDFRHLAAPTHRLGHINYHAFTRVSNYAGGHSIALTPPLA